MFPLLVLFLVLSVSGYSGTVNYAINGGTIQNATLDHTDNSLLIDLSATSPSGQLAIELPKTMINTNSTFLVLDQGYLVDNIQLGNSQCCNNIVIPFSQGDQRLVITGTTSAPDMTTGITIGVLIVALITSIILSNNRLGKLK